MSALVAGAAAAPRLGFAEPQFRPPEGQLAPIQEDHTPAAVPQAGTVSAAAAQAGVHSQAAARSAAAGPRAGQTSSAVEDADQAGTPAAQPQRSAAEPSTSAMQAQQSGDIAGTSTSADQPGSSRAANANAPAVPRHVAHEPLGKAQPLSDEQLLQAARGRSAAARLHSCAAGGLACTCTARRPAWHRVWSHPLSSCNVRPCKAACGSSSFLLFP